MTMHDIDSQRSTKVGQVNKVPEPTSGHIVIGPKPEPKLWTSEERAEINAAVTKAFAD